MEMWFMRCCLQRAPIFSTGLPVSDFAVEGYDEAIADVDESAGFVPAADVCGGDVPSCQGVVAEQCITIESMCVS